MSNQAVLVCARAYFARARAGARAGAPGRAGQGGGPARRAADEQGNWGGVHATGCAGATLRTHGLDLTGGEGADVIFECAGGSVKQGLAGDRALKQAMHAVRSGGKLVGVSWFGAPLQLDVDLLRERSVRYLFPDISSQAHLEYTVRLMATGRISMAPTIRHVLEGIDKVPEAFEITANKGKYQAINPAQVVMVG